MMSDEQKLRKLIEEFGLSEWQNQILQHVKPSIRITPEKADDTSLGIGVSKLGGLPDLPPHIEWAQYHDKSLFFVAQLNLSELQPFVTEPALPQTGLLSFFIRNEYLYDDKLKLNSKAWRVFYFSDSELAQLQRKQRPTDVAHMTWIYEPCAMKFAQELTIPETLQPFPIRNDEEFKYVELKDKFIFGERGWATRILGYPDSPQGSDIFSHCEAASYDLGLSISGDEAQEKAASEWVLLFQVDSEGDANMLWDDTGILYFCIKRQALQQRKFESVVVYIEGV